MKANQVFNFLLQAVVVVALSGCIASKQPLGSIVKSPDAKLWNAKWITAGGKTFRTRVNEGGAIEISGLSKLNTEDTKFPDPAEVVLSTLGDCQMLNLRSEVEDDDMFSSKREKEIGATYLFARVVTGNEQPFLALFRADSDAFARTVSQGNLAAEKIPPRLLGPPLILNPVSPGMARRLKANGVRVDRLFEPDPFFVAVRSDWKKQ